jgi:hypothetical protein
MFLFLTRFALVVLLETPLAVPELQRPNQPAAAEQRTIERLLETLERNPRKGAVLDKVYGYHVELGTVERLVQSFRTRVEKDPNDVALAVGSLAFVITPEGLKLHWLSERREADWTELAADILVSHPTIPAKASTLKPGEWNNVGLSLENNHVKILDNGVLAGRVELGKGGSRQFGLYHDRSRSTAMVRDPRLLGPWPNKLSENAMQDLLHAFGE